MYISMQGPWTVKVKSNEGNSPNRRFIIDGTGTAADKAYPGTAGLTVNLSALPYDKLWTINIQCKVGGVYQGSDTQIKFPTNVGGNYQFDIQSNDAGSGIDTVLDDLILTCSTPVTPNDYLVYGNVTTYSGNCLFNPCYPKWIVIESNAALIQALKNPLLSDIIYKLYPERIPHIPNPPDPPEFKTFTPIMINLLDTNQSVDRVANVFSRKVTKSDVNVKSKKNIADTTNYNLQFEKSISIPTVQSEIAYKYDNVALAKMIDGMYKFCSESPAPFLTLRFDQYDRTLSELAGGPYTGTGNRFFEGNVITDKNGNYILRFYQSFAEQLHEASVDVPPGGNVLIEYRPDLIVSVLDSNPSTSVLYESAPYYNIPNLYRLDLCLPASQIPQGFSCFNGNLIGSLGNVFVGGNQNVTGATTNIALDRNGYNNHLHSDGRITVHNSQASFLIDCACWGGAIDVKGCMYNTQRKLTDPIISYYTIRYKKPGGYWQFVNEAYTHPLFSKRNLPNYNGDPVGPFMKTVNVDGTPTINVPTYKNIQKEVMYDGIDWEYSNLDRYMILNSYIYQGTDPGTVYFMVEGYDASGNLVPGAKDLIALYIDNKQLGFSLDNVWIDADGVNIVAAECGLYRIKEAYLNAPIKVQFKANDQWGFLDSYNLVFSKCGSIGFVPDETPSGKTSGNANDVGNVNGADIDADNCPGYNGTAELDKFGDVNSHIVLFTPTVGNKWLEPTQSFTVLTFHLSAAKRITNGYNTGLEVYPYSVWTSVYVERLS